VAFVIPAHFIGGILGVTLVRLLLVDVLSGSLGKGWAGQAVMPVIYTDNGLSGWNVRHSQREEEV
jgi:hypothetical protein